MGVPIGRKSRITAALLAILLGLVGAHKFYLRHPKLGILYIVLTCTVVGGVFTGWGSIIEGVVYLTKSNKDFQRIYVQEHRAMF